MNIHLLGIRHHGPGSSKSLLKALQEIKPDVILLEGTEESDELLKHIANPELKPPVAMLIYNPKDLGQAVYYPFTEFSPEWQTIKYALSHKVPVVNFDLPQAIRFGLTTAPSEQEPRSEKGTQDGSDSEEKVENFNYELIRRDPLGYMARLAGYEDSERWWEVTFEQFQGDASEVFDSILSIMTALREEQPLGQNADALIEHLREAYMRKCLREAIKNRYQRIAVVCGAWHTAALNLDAHPAKADNVLLKGLPKVKTQATWIPWTYERIARSSGYGAGVISPAWYKLLFQSPENAVIEWMTKVAQLFRSEDLDASSAHVIEAVRLANTLAAMRGQLLPGIDELFESAQTVFTAGDSSPFELIVQRLIVGEEMGEVPAEIPTIPLQQDIEAQVKSLRLSKYQAPIDQEIKKEGLDLRNEFDRKQSIFLHRLNLIGVPWGKEKSYSGREKTTLKEYWMLNWKPEFILQIIEAGMWGNTVELAASNLALSQAREAFSLTQLSELLDRVIKAKLPEAMDRLVLMLRDMAALTKDVPVLMRTLPGLVNIMRYGDVRKSDLTMLNALLKELVPRICVGLPSACAGIDEDASQQIFELIISTHRALNLLQDADFSAQWAATLKLLSDSQTVQGILQGISVRLLFDTRVLDIEATANKMSFALSKGTEVKLAAGWVQGFLHGSGLLLIHNPLLWNIVDSWVAQLSPDNFQGLLPLLRRSFSSFSQPEREKMMQIAKHGQSVATTSRRNSEWDAERIKTVLDTVQTLLC